MSLVTRQKQIDSFIVRWRENEGGAERANFPLFLTELATLLDLPSPNPADASRAKNDYVFERAVTFKDEAGKSGHGRIDLYKRGCFVLEAKQSREKGGIKEVALPSHQQSLPGMDADGPRGRRSANRGWDVLMRNAREQAEQYARALPTEHGWPPFILVCDVGHAIEVFADFSGQGKNYRQFPDRAGFRIYLDDLAVPDIQDRLRAIWTDPHSLDPAKRSAAVTRDIAARLANVSKRLEEKRGYQPEPVAHFLMRCMFTMFAEDTGLLERGSFLDVLADARTNPASFAPMLEDLWRTMDTGGFSPVLRKTVRKFNGGLFAEKTAIPLEKEEIGELYEAAKHDWTEVEPAIFGTLLEQALDKEERKRLGAHYTPRAYVERLVNATVIDPLQAEWEGAVLGTVERERETDRNAAIKAVHDFHEKLAGTRVLDPACGTGNFLYVALELMKRLEGDVLEVLADLGGQEALALETSTVHPRNFLGMELNPRAAAIAELVLWLGYLQWQMRNGASISDPVLEKLSNIRVMDAVVKHDGERPNADRSATELANPRRPEWPEADFIVGNPPFIGGKDIRSRLGDGYATALWKANPKINKSADFVMYWWDRAADQLIRKGSRLRRFGFVTTNSITMDFSRRTLAKYLDGKVPVSLVLAIPDHPWTKATRDTAAVRIAMTVAETGKREGLVLNVIREEGLETDAAEIEFTENRGDVHADLTVGADVTAAKFLRANDAICTPGVKLHGAGFIVTAQQAELLGLGRREGLERHIRPYRNGRDLTARARGVLVIDLDGLSETEVRQRFPEVYQHLLVTVKPERDRNNEEYRRTNWWLFGRRNTILRGFLHDLPRYIATVETAKHRVFQFLDVSILPDNKLINIGSNAAHVLGILSSQIHYKWYLANAGMIGVYDAPAVYVKTSSFDPFPFPDTSPDQQARIGVLAEELDAIRKNVLVEHGDLTLTGLYNLRDKVRKREPLDMVEQDQRQRGLIDLISELHNRIDAAVADAYGWPHDLSDEQIVTRLVALNAERHAEEKAGKVRWLRPDYQIARAGVPQLPVRGKAEQIEALLPIEKARKPAFPREAIGQTAAVIADLRSGSAISAAEIARRYSQGKRVERRIEATLEALERLGHVVRDGDRFLLRKAA